jgi:hypothetical protein
VCPSSGGVLTSCGMQIAFLVDLYDIPAELVVNSDQTGIPLVPSSDYTRAPKGAKDVSTHGHGDKRQITIVPSTAATGESLPLQVIYQGKTQQSLPSIMKRSGAKFAGALLLSTSVRLQALQILARFLIVLRARSACVCPLHLPFVQTSRVCG